MPSRVSDFLKLAVTERTSTPIYYQYKRVEFKNITYVALYYSVFYVINPGFHVMALPCLPLVGFHVADVEEGRRKKRRARHPKMMSKMQSMIRM